MAFLDALALRLGRRLPLVLQTEATECGLACLAMIAGYHGHQPAKRSWPTPSSRFRWRCGTTTSRSASRPAAWRAPANWSNSRGKAWRWCRAATAQGSAA